ncbi:hypothetical protein CsSME_00016587 [Camellia sinensis var. sinensis]
MKIRKELHLKRRADGSFEKPQALYSLSSDERHGFCEFLKSIKYPDGYAANISKCVSTKGEKLTGLKSHDCHILLQRLLSIGMRGYLHNDICVTLFELGNFFQELCSKTLKVKDLENLEDCIVLILCKLEKIFPPAFFDVMVHLAIHLPREAILGGPVQHKNLLENQGARDITKRQKEEFPKWFKEHMNHLRAQGLPEATDELWSLANGPSSIMARPGKVRSAASSKVALLTQRAPARVVVPTQHAPSNLTPPAHSVPSINALCIQVAPSTNATTTQAVPSTNATTTQATPSTNEATTQVALSTISSRTRSTQVKG